MLNALNERMIQANNSPAKQSVNVLIISRYILSVILTLLVETDNFQTKILLYTKRQRQSEQILCSILSNLLFSLFFFSQKIIIIYLSLTGR